MQAPSPTYLRARMDLIREKLATSDPNEMQTALLRNGVFYDENQIQQHAKKMEFPFSTLSFTELCTFNTWFVLHPEKICGNEVVTTSKEFPITIQGDKSKIISTIEKQQSYSLIEMEALALEYELQMNQL